MKLINHHFQVMMQKPILAHIKAAPDYKTFYALPILDSNAQASDLLVRYETISGFSLNHFKWKSTTQIKDDMDSPAILNFLNRHVTGFRLFDKEETAKKFNNKNTLTDTLNTHYQPIFLIRLLSNKIFLRFIIEELSDKQKVLAQHSEPSYQINKNRVRVLYAMLYWTAPNKPTESHGGMNTRLEDHFRMDNQSGCTIS